MTKFENDTLEHLLVMKRAEIMEQLAVETSGDNKRLLEKTLESINNYLAASAFMKLL